MQTPDMNDWNPLLYNDKHSFVYESGAGLLKLLNPEKGERILDVGCGPGQLTAQISEAGATVVGIDSSPQMIADAKSRFPGIEFYVMDASDFSFDEPFDAVFSNAALHWVLNKEGAAACMYRALKPGGRLVAEFGGRGNINIILTQLRQSLRIHGLQENAGRELWYFPSIGEYASLLESQGFRVMLAQHFDRPTELADSEHGVEEWLQMFGSGFFKGVNTELKDKIKEEVQQPLKSKIFHNGKWYADYKRLRIMAVKQ
jgi:trans-aconitate methyltransferase